MKNTKSSKLNAGKNIIKASGVRSLDRIGVNQYITYIEEQDVKENFSLDSFDHLGYGKN